jgi:hypothetical protein
MPVALPHRVYLIALASDPTARPWVVALCRQFGDGGDAEADSCQTPLALASDPTGDVVGHAMSVPVSQRVHDLLIALVDADEVPAGVVYAVADHLTGVVTRTNHPDPAVLGLAWDTEGSLRRVGMTFRRDPKSLPESRP